MYVWPPTVYKFPTTNSQNSTNSNSPNENNTQMNLLSHSPTHFIVLLSLLLLCCTTTTTLAQLHIVEYDGKDFNCSSTPLRIKTYSTSATCARGVNGQSYHARCTPGGAYEIRWNQNFTLLCSNPLSTTVWESGDANGVCITGNQLSYRVFCQNSTVSPIENLPKPTAPATTFVYQEQKYQNNACYSKWTTDIETTQNSTTNACFKRFGIPPANWRCEKDGVTMTWWEDSTGGAICNTGTKHTKKIPFAVCTQDPSYLPEALTIFSCSPVSHANGANLIGHLLMSAVIMLGPLFFT